MKNQQVTIETETPNPPQWVKNAGAEAVWAWKASLAWRADAAAANGKGEQQIRRVLINDAKRAYHE